MNQGRHPGGLTVVVRASASWLRNVLLCNEYIASITKKPTVIPNTVAWPGRPVSGTVIVAGVCTCRWRRGPMREYRVATTRTLEPLADAYAKLAWADVHINALVAAITGVDENTAPVTTEDASAHPYDGFFKPLSPEIPTGWPSSSPTRSITCGLRWTISCQRLQRPTATPISSPRFLSARTKSTCESIHR
jgi:hypothetical protein